MDAFGYFRSVLPGGDVILRLQKSRCYRRCSYAASGSAMCFWIARLFRSAYGGILCKLNKVKHNEAQAQSPQRYVK